MNYFDLFITLIFVVKITFIIVSLYRLYIKNKKPDKATLLESLDFWKERLEFIFISLMSILLIYLFNPKFNRAVIIDGETKTLLFLFGIVLLLTENWSDFIQESDWFKKFQNIIGRP